MTPAPAWTAKRRQERRQQQYSALLPPRSRWTFTHDWDRFNDNFKGKTANCWAAFANLNSKELFDVGGFLSSDSWRFFRGFPR